MREIKFRGYSKIFDIMFTNDMLEMATASMVGICKKELKKIDPAATEIQMGLFLPTYDEDLMLMQYTGVKDKNGVEIYEGDIVKHEAWVGSASLRDIIGTVIFKDGCFAIKTKYGDKYLYTGINEVIGNIYENKYLLEEK